MKYLDLLYESEQHLEEHTSFDSDAASFKLFSSGARWMWERMNELQGFKADEFNPEVNYAAFGWLKYVLSMGGFLLTLVLFYQVNIYLMPLSILVFYFIEIHFLFLFPLLIDNVKSPLSTCLELTYTMGLLTSLSVVIPIGFYMLVGLLNLKHPLKNWHTGCLAILIWYRNEARQKL